MTLKPGIYKATVRGVADVTITVVKDEDWVLSAVRIEDWLTHDPEFVTDAHPLIVLDPNDATVFAFLAHHAASGSSIVQDLASMMTAQTTPPRIEEPGLWGVADAGCPHQDDRGPWVRDEFGWARIGSEQIRTHNHDAWDDLIDPTLVREGLEP